MIELYDSKITDMLTRMDGKPGSLKLLIKTDAKTEQEFIEDFGTLYLKTISKYSKNPDAIDWPFLLLKFADIVCKMRNYKSNVIQKTIYISGGGEPGDSSLLKLDDEGIFYGAPDASSPDSIEEAAQKEIDKKKVAGKGG